MGFERLFYSSVSGTVTHGPTATKSEFLPVNLTDIILNGSFVTISVGVMIGLWVYLKKMTVHDLWAVKPKDLSQRDLEAQGALHNQLLQDNKADGAEHAKLSAASMMAHVR